MTTLNKEALIVKIGEAIHRYTRTLEFMDDFDSCAAGEAALRALGEALPEPAQEHPSEIKGSLLYREIHQGQKFANLYRQLKEFARD